MTTIQDWLAVMSAPDRRGSSSPCRRGCCWTPMGHSGAASELCTCHLTYGGDR